jgi:hypothetical protein
MVFLIGVCCGLAIAYLAFVGFLAYVAFAHWK